MIARQYQKHHQIKKSPETNFTYPHKNIVHLCRYRNNFKTQIMSNISPRIWLYGILFLLPVTSFAQKIKWDTTSHYFGCIEENNGKVNHTFHITNTGNSPLIIRHVESSCGCTVTRWSRQPIPPGKTTSITITFNPQNREGKFNKIITVYTNATVPNHILKISGNVIKKKTSTEEQYPFASGSLRHDKNTLTLDPKHPYQIIQFLNTNKKNISIIHVDTPRYLQVNVNFKKLRNKEKGYITVIPHPNFFLESNENNEIIIYTNQGEKIHIRIFK